MLDVFSITFVADTKIIFRFDFEAPLTQSTEKIFFFSIKGFFCRPWLLLEKTRCFTFKACVPYFRQIFIFSPNDSPSKAMKNAFYFI